MKLISSNNSEYIQSKIMLVADLISILISCWGVSSMVVTPVAGSSCTITDYSEVSKVVSSCTKIVLKSFEVPAGKTLNLNLQPGTFLIIDGTIKFGKSNWAGPLVKIQGRRIKVSGTPGSVFDGQGAEYWDGKGSQGTKKPVLLRVNAHESEFYNINLLNCPLRCASIGGSDIFLNGWTIDVSEAGNLGVNTDGFDVSGHNMTIINSRVFNQDDCVVVNRGSDMFFRNIYCKGGHGLSVAVGIDPTVYENNVVSNITYQDCIVENSINGIHVKTVKGGGPGLISNVNYNRIRMMNIKEFAIRIHQDYPSNDKKPVGNVPIDDLKISHVEGNMKGPRSSVVEVLCASGACSNWKWSDISVTGNKLPCSMNYKPSGFSC